MASAVGLLEAVTGAIGESDAEIGGIAITRLTAPVTAGVVLSATYTWDGTTTVLSGDTSEVSAGDFLRLDVDGQYFEITSITPNVSVTISNPEALVIPTGSSQSSKAITSLPVETTLDFADEGKVSCDGVVYYYASKTNQSFDEITHLVGGVAVAGVQRQHRIESAVYDRNRDRNAIDLVRRAMLVEYAEGEDLNALGRNLGVLRSAFLAGDEQFRSILKVLAYNPKGTLYGLQLALTGLVGEGNFTIYEDLINNPAKVFIALAAGAVISDRAQGSAYVEESEVHPADSTTQITLDHPVFDGGALHIELAPYELETPADQVLPSDASLTWEPYPGATPIAQWTLVGGSGIGYSSFYQATGFGSPTAKSYFAHVARCMPGTEAVFSASIRALNNTLSPATDLNRIPCMIVHTLGGRLYRLGFWQNVLYWRVGWQDDTGAWLTAPIQVIDNVTTDTDFHRVSIRVHADGSATWYWDDIPQETLLESVFSTTPKENEETIIGYVGGSDVKAPYFLLKWLKQSYRSPGRDYWAAEAADGVVALGSRTLTTAALTFVSTDVGSGFTTRNSAVTNAQGGNNNGRWLVESQGGTTATLIGETWTGASVQGANPDRVVLPFDQPLLRFPDDLGKEIEIIGSELGQDGVYVIDKLLDPDTLTDIELGASPQPQLTNVCEVVSGGFVSETDLSFRLRPNFAAESNLEWVLQDAGTITSNVLTLRQDVSAIPAVARVFAVAYAQVLSAQLLRNADIANDLISTDPLDFTYWPFYLADPLGYARDYLSSVTAAGVIPDFTLE